MRVRVLQGLDGARAARGTAVVIDVFRAFTHACVLLDRGAARLLVAEHVEDAFALRRRIPEVVLAGEREGRRIAGFDLGNSPSESLDAAVAGRPVVLTTSAGTRGLFAAAAAGADPVLAAGFVNAGATAGHVCAATPAHVTLVCMGESGRSAAAEDDACGAWLAARLMGAPFALAARLAAVRAAPSARKFGDPARPWFPPADLDCCLDPDRYGFALQLVRAADGRAELARIEPRPAPGGPPRPPNLR